jgi:1-phosphofructokinase family hexose kinase
MILIAAPTPSYQRRLVFDRVTLDEVNRANEVEIIAAGKGVNCARSLIRLGSPAFVLQFLGGDTGDWVASALTKEDVPTRNILVPTATRICTTVIDRSSGMVTELVENAGHVDFKAVSEFKEVFEDLVGKAQVAVMTGTIPDGVEPSFYGDLLRMVRKYNLPTIVDAQGKSLLAACEQTPLLVKPNRQEIELATGIHCEELKDLRRAIHRLHRLGAVWVLVTQGAGGALLSDGKVITKFQPPKIKSYNPTGSGDSLSAGIAIALNERKGMIEAVRYGIACATANAESDGYGFLNPSRAEKLVRLVKISSVK